MRQGTHHHRSSTEAIVRQQQHTSFLASIAGKHLIIRHAMDWWVLAGSACSTEKSR